MCLFLKKRIVEWQRFCTLKKKILLYAFVRKKWWRNKMKESFKRTDTGKILSLMTQMGPILHQLIVIIKNISLLLPFFYKNWVNLCQNWFDLQFLMVFEIWVYFQKRSNSISKIMCLLVCLFIFTLYLRKKEGREH